MGGIGNAVLIASLGNDAKKLEEMSDGLQEIILHSPSMSEEQRSKLTEEVARRQKAASDLRKLIIDLS